MPRRLVLVAASGLAREVAGVAELVSDYELVGCLDDDETLWGTMVGQLQVLGGIDTIGSMSGVEVVVCAGKGAVRRDIVNRLAHLGVAADRYATLVHPSVEIPHSCSLGKGTVVLAHTALTADVSLGAHVVVMPGCTLTHDDVVEDFVTLTGGVSLAGTVHVREAAYVGMNASIREGLTIGAGSVVGMGAVITDNVPPGETWAGVPARPLVHRTTEAAT